MLLFLSDLHLTDNADRSTIDLVRLAETLDHLLARAVRNGVEDIKLVLLGDVFELLKSSVWLDRRLRPWEAATPQHVEAVADIFTASVAANRLFLENLDRLARDYPVKYVYLAGNHDLPLNTAMGTLARRELRKILRLAGSDSLFDTVFVDPAHAVLAKHGHEWDSTNRYGPHGEDGRETCAIGDAVVIEVLLRLPLLVAEALGTSAGDPDLLFLHELDNVRPQTPPVMARWTLTALERLGGHRPAAAQAIRRALRELGETLDGVIREVPFETLQTLKWWRPFLVQAGKAFLDRWDALTVAVRLPRGMEDHPSYRANARMDLEIASGTAGGPRYRYILCGHTHIHELVPLETGRGGPPPLYMNTGTWRRIHRLTDGPRRPVARSFSTWQEECVVCIYSPADQQRGFPPFEIHRSTRGQILLQH